MNNVGLVIGAMKSGTTTLYRDLTTVPDLHLLPKEGGIFSRGAGSFPGSARHTLEVCSDYTMAHLFPGVPDRVARTLGTSVPLIYIVRDPLERLESHLRHLSSLGEEVDVERLDETSHPVLTSMYGYQVRQWIDAGHSGVHLIDFHEYTADRLSGAATVAALVGAPAPILSADPASKIENASADLRSSRSGTVRSIVRSRAYQRVRPFIPRPVRERLKNSPLTERADLDIQLPLRVRERLAEIFSADLAELGRLVDEVPAWVRDGGKNS